MSGNQDQSNEPMDMRTSAVATHEYFTSMRAAGFTYEEALYLVGCMISGGPRLPAGEETA